MAQSGEYKPILIVLGIGAVLGGFIGGHFTDTTFSILWAALGSVGLIGAIFLFWLIFINPSVSRKERRAKELNQIFEDSMRLGERLAPAAKGEDSIPPEMRVILDKVAGESRTPGETRLAMMSLSALAAYGWKRTGLKPEEAVLGAATCMVLERRGSSAQRQQATKLRVTAIKWANEDLSQTAKWGAECLMLGASGAAEKVP